MSFDIAPGETVALVGESGSGKSVTALSVAKLLNYPTAFHPTGEIMFKSKDLLKASEMEMLQVRGADITMVFQEPMTSLNPLHTISRQIGEILRLHRRLGEKEARARTLEMLELVGIREAESRLDAYPHELSGGQATARDDRHGARQRTRPAHRRRAQPRHSTSLCRPRFSPCSPI